MMSIDGSHEGNACNEMVALLLDAGGGEQLTDMLVSALREAHQFLAEDEPVETRH
ncbi:hypothetical protein [Mycoplana dimorpha]|uniref:Uncharacterized protein n=1 Tax=Mycoplana dimorpha TaxID=28320 RepID=A0A2T5BB35_MYCDI|nr:hypothetical protein [Mycoplana dimorpha]PTM96185.1 hypothetical protein C7449_103199 [Mycoplana dimorpha]